MENMIEACQSSLSRLDVTLQEHRIAPSARISEVLYYTVLRLCMSEMENLICNKKNCIISSQTLTHTLLFHLFFVFSSIISMFLSTLLSADSSDDLQTPHMHPALNFTLRYFYRRRTNPVTHNWQCINWNSRIASCDWYEPTKLERLSGRVRSRSGTRGKDKST